LLLATDAVGMGMNLNIKRLYRTTSNSKRTCTAWKNYKIFLIPLIYRYVFRVIFTQLITQGQVLPSYFVKQIAGRAGRFASRYCTGEVCLMDKAFPKHYGLSALYRLAAFYPQK
jgi:hypothetical protein